MKKRKQHCLHGPILQAAEASAAWMQTAFGALTESLNSQRQQLQAYATQQHAASHATLQHTQAAIALARQHLQEANSATANCQQTVGQTLDAHSSSLNAFDRSFADDMQDEQVKPLCTFVGKSAHHMASMLACILPYGLNGKHM